METILYILGCLVYLVITIWTCGYLAALGTVEGEEVSYWKEGPFPFIAGLLWPIVLPFVFGLGSLFKTLSDLGIRFRYRQVEKRKAREEDLKRIRIELAEATADLENEIEHGNLESNHL
jgi:hypothetical protein